VVVGVERRWPRGLVLRGRTGPRVLSGITVCVAVERVSRQRIIGAKVLNHLLALGRPE
jgi:hypothetical protein